VSSSVPCDILGFVCRYLATASSDHTVKIWNVDGFKLERTLVGNVWSLLLTILHLILILCFRMRSWNITGNQLLRPSALGLGLCILGRWCLSDNRYELHRVALCLPRWFNSCTVNRSVLSCSFFRHHSEAMDDVNRRGHRVYQGHHKATVCCALHDGAESAPS